MHIKKSVLCLLALLTVLSLTGCSLFKKSCYNKSIDSKNFSEIKDIQKIKFEIINNNSVSFDEAIGAYFNDNPNANTDVNDFNNQLKILDDIYVKGVVGKAQDGYVLLDRDNYIVFVKYLNESLNIEKITDEQKLMDVLNSKTNNYFSFMPINEDKREFYHEITKDAYKIIGTFNSRLPFLKNTKLAGYVTVMEDRNKNSAFMIVLTDKAFNGNTKKNMEYMVKSLVFNKDSQSTANGTLEFTNKEFLILHNSKNVLFDTTQPIIRPNETAGKQNSDSKYRYITFSEISKDGEMYEILTLKEGTKYVDNGFISAVMDNLTFSSMVYSENKQVDLAFIEKRITARANAFLSTLKASPQVYANIVFNGVFVSDSSAYTIITYDLKQGKDAYPCIEIYKEDIKDGAIISYNISYKPLIPASNDSKAAYNEIMAEIGLRK